MQNRWNFLKTGFYEGIKVRMGENTHPRPTSSPNSSTATGSQPASAMTEMAAIDVIDLYSKVSNLGVPVWIDGGWAVDALLGEQTRLHQDLDIVIQEKDLPALRRLLGEEGYEDVKRNDTTPWNFVLGDDKGHEVDVHAFVYDSDGNGVYGPRGVTYPPAALSGTGTIDGQVVSCISAESLVKFHTGYALQMTDYHDVTALCEQFGTEYPEEYAHLEVPDQPG